MFAKPCIHNMKMNNASQSSTNAVQIVFKFDGKALSFNDKRVLYDAHKNVVATMKQKVRHKIYSAAPMTLFSMLTGQGWTIPLSPRHDVLHASLQVESACILP